MDILVIVVAALLLIVVIGLRLVFETWQFKRNARVVIGLFRDRGATEQGRACGLDELGLERPVWLRFGLRNYKSEALRTLIGRGVVRNTTDGRYYLSPQELNKLTWLNE